MARGEDLVIRRGWPGISRRGGPPTRRTVIASGAGPLAATSSCLSACRRHDAADGMLAQRLCLLAVLPLWLRRMIKPVTDVDSPE